MGIKSGYAYAFNGTRRWRASSDERWEIVCTSADEKAELLGEREIDGAKCRVYRCTDGKLRAQTVASGAP